MIKQCLPLALTSLVVFGVAQADPLIVGVAYSGKDTPVGGKFDSPSTPSINNNGDIVFEAAATAPTYNRKLWVGKQNNLRIVAENDSPAPGGGTFDQFYEPFILNDDGHVAFGGVVEGAGIQSTNDERLFAENGSNGVALVAGEGLTLPDSATLVALNRIVGFRFNKGDRIVFEGLMQRLPAVREAIFKGEIGNIRKVAETLQPASGYSTGFVYSNFDGISISDTGTVSFGADFWEIDPNNPLTFPLFPSSEFAFYNDEPGSPATIYKSTTPIPGILSGYVLDFFSDFVAANDNFGAQGVVENPNNTADRGGAFFASVGGGPLEFIAGFPEIAPGTEGAVYSILNPTPQLLNSAGYVAFSATLTGNGVTSLNNTGIWAGTKGNIRLIARKGSQAPGVPAGVTFNTFGSSVIDTPVVMNAAGEVAFVATLSGPGVNTNNRYGIWMTDGSNGQLQLLIRAGTPTAVETGVTKTFTRFYLLDGATSEGGAAHSLNDFGTIAFLAEHADFGGGVYVGRLSGGSSPATPTPIPTSTPIPASTPTAPGTPIPGITPTGITDECPDDPLKTTPGSCGCGVPDADLNGNGILDCSAKNDIGAELAKLGLLVGKLKPAGGSKAVKAAQALVKSEVRALIGLLLPAVQKAHAAAIVGQTQKNFLKLVTDLNKKVSKALKGSKRTFAADKKAAKASIKKLNGAL